MFATSWTVAIVVAMPKLPEIKNEMANVLALPVMRQLIVLTRLLFGLSLKAHVFANFSSTDASYRFVKALLFNFVTYVTTVSDVYNVRN